MLTITPLGGCGEIGLNMMAVSYEQYILVIDGGLMFPEEYMPGVDIVIPDFQYLRDNKEMVQSIILTHGHEDHIGAMPFFLRDFDIPVYGTRFTLQLLAEKLKEHNLLDKVTLRKVKAGEVARFGPFTIEFIKVNHSIVDGFGMAIETPEGVLVHTGDFKIDLTSFGERSTDLLRFAHYGDRNVLALLSDSTNVEREGFTLSESEVQKTLENLFNSSHGRMIVAVFASNISRIQQVIDLAVKYDRKVYFSGKSMMTNVRIAREEGFIRIPDDMEINDHVLESIPDEKIVIVTTGSQGEPMSSLTRMARNRHKNLRIKKGDTIILSSRFIPGNEKAITGIINNLYRMGAEVVYEKVSHIHSSGHAYREELKLILNLVRPKYFIPIHGEFRHLVKHAQLAMESGLPLEQTFILEDGVPLHFQHGTAQIGEKVPSGRILVDGKGVGDIGELVLRDRRRLSGDGVVISLLAVDEQTGEIIYGPDIISRGFVFEDKGGFILEEAKCLVFEILDELKKSPHIDWVEVGLDIEKQLKRFFYKIIERRPIILPIIIPV